MPHTFPITVGPDTRSSEYLRITNNSVAGGNLIIYNFQQETQVGLNHTQGLQFVFMTAIEQL